MTVTDSVGRSKGLLTSFVDEDLAVFPWPSEAHISAPLYLPKHGNSIYHI